MPKKCDICFEECFTVKLGCNHRYCVSCLRGHVAIAMRDTNRFPPSCCGAELSPIARFAPYIGKDLMEKYEALEIELATTDRVYCSRKTCSAFIPPKLYQGSHIPRDGTISCPECSQRTCINCKQPEHRSPCALGAANIEDESAIELAKSEGWRRCFRCKTMIEHTTGCSHVVCSCGAQICFKYVASPLR